VTVILVPVLLGMVTLPAMIASTLASVVEIF